MAALSKKPSFKVASTADELRTQRGNLTKQLNSGSPEQKKAAQANLAKVKESLINVNKQAAAPTPAQSYQQTVGAANEAQQGLLNQIQEQPAFTAPQNIPIQSFNPQVQPVQQFNPQDFQASYDNAYNASLNEFNRNNQSVFEQQNKDFEQMAAEKGWDPNSEVAKGRFKQVQDAQNNARQGAMNNATQAGLAAQNQGFGQSLATHGQNMAGQNQQYTQAFNTFGQNLNANNQQFGQAATSYQMPYQALGALSPYFGAQNQGFMQNQQNQFNAGQAQLDRENQRWMLQNAPRGGGGGGGLSLNDQMALQNNNFYNQMAMMGMQQGNQMPNQAANSAIGGFAAGVSNGIVNGLTR